MASYSTGVWGIDLGLCALKAIRLQNTPDGVKATAFDYIEHPKILSQPDADPDQLTREALEQFLSRNNLRGDMVVISVPGQSGLARFVKLPPVEERKIAEIVKFEAKQQIPFPLDEVVWDFQKIGTPMVTDGLALETEIGLFAMKKDMVNRSLQQFREVHIECHAVQMAPLALINYVAYDLLNKNVKVGGGTAEEGGEESSGEKNCVVALDVGTDNSNLVITDGEKVIWQRPIPLGGNHFTRALTKDMKLTFAKAEHLKRNAVKSPDLRKILASLKSVLNDFVGEVQRSLGYFTNTHRDANILYMVGLGGGFRLPGLQKFLQEKLQLEVRKIPKFERLGGEDVTSAPQFTENVLGFAVPYGLALQGLKLSRLQTNLLPYEVRVERLVRGKKPWAAAAAACLLVAVAGLTYGKNLEKAAVNAPEIAQAKSIYTEAMNQKKKRDAEYAEAETKLKASADSYRTLVAGVEERFNWHQLMQYINCTLPGPDGSKLVEVSSRGVPVKTKFFTPDAVEAFRKLEMRRTPTRQQKEKQNPGQAIEDEEFIKKHLIQFSIEGIHALYSDDLGAYLKNIFDATPLLRGMDEGEKNLVRQIKDLKEKGEPISDELKKPNPEKKFRGLPEKFWAVEIRGYTYNQFGEEFIENVLLENLRYPERVNPKLFPTANATMTGKTVVPPLGPEEKRLREQVLDQLYFLFLYKNTEVKNPQPGTFVDIKSSHLPNLLKPPMLVGGPPGLGGGGGGGGEGQAGPGAGAEKPKFDRAVWKPIGDIAGTAHGSPAGGPLNFGGRGGPGFVAPPPPPPPVVIAKDDKTPVNRQPRREFVILFVWKELLPSTPELAKKD